MYISTTLPGFKAKFINKGKEIRMSEETEPAEETPEVIENEPVTETPVEDPKHFGDEGAPTVGHL